MKAKETQGYFFVGLESCIMLVICITLNDFLNGTTRQLCCVNIILSVKVTSISFVRRKGKTIKSRISCTLYMIALAQSNKTS
jgi:hypothetical protein